MAQVITQHLLSEQEASGDLLEIRNGFTLSGRIRRPSANNNFPLLVHTAPSSCLFDDVTLSLIVPTLRVLNGRISIDVEIGSTGRLKQIEQLILHPEAIKRGYNTGRGGLNFESDRSADQFIYNATHKVPNSITILEKFRLKRDLSIRVTAASILGDDSVTAFIYGKVERYTEVP